MKIWEFAVIAVVAGIVGFMGFIIDRKNDQIDQLTKVAGICKEAVRLRDATEPPACDRSAERAHKDCQGHLDECNQHLGELIAYKCDPCPVAWYVAEQEGAAQKMTGPGKIECPATEPVVWVSPYEGGLIDWSFMCTPKDPKKP